MTNRVKKWNKMFQEWKKTVIYLNQDEEMPEFLAMIEEDMK